MTTLKVNVVRKPTIKVKVLPTFPSNVVAQNFLTVTNSGGTYTFSVDYTKLPSGSVTNPLTTFVAVFDQTSGVYKIVSALSFITGITQSEQNITTAGPIVVGDNTGIVRVNQTVGAPITLIMGAASSKTCNVLISDWKGDAGTNNITINLSGSDKFPGGLTSWKIDGDTGSIFLRPIAGVGYVL